MESDFESKDKHHVDFFSVSEFDISRYLEVGMK